MFALMVASNDYPDMVAAKGSANKPKDAGALIDLHRSLTSMRRTSRSYMANT